MTITTGSFDSYGIPQGSPNRLDDLADVDVAEVKEGDSVIFVAGRWIPGAGSEVAIQNTQPEDEGVELWVNEDEPDPPPALSMETADTLYVKNIGDSMTGSLKLNVPRHYGVMFIEPGGEERVIGIRTTTSGAAGIGTFKPGTDATDPLGLQPFGVGEPTQAEHAITKAYSESSNAGLKTNIQIAGGWADLGGAYAGAWATAYGPLVTIEAVLKVTVNYQMAAGGSFQMAAVGPGYRPAHDVIADCMYAPTGATTYRTARMTISAGGPIYLVPATTETLVAASGWVSFQVTYRRG